jgi:branched-chain amino acid aminotransferase
MQPVPEELFGKAIRLALEKNLDFVPPYGTGATLYFRPLLIGTTPRLGVGPGRDFEFIVIPSPIGPYYPGKFHCTTFIVNRYVDRAAPFGTGQFKVGGNYAASFRATEAAHAVGCDCIFLDAKQHKYIDECSAANFIGIKEVKGDGLQVTGYEYLTPKSSAILPSITNNSLMTLARERGMKVTQRRIRLEELEQMSEAAACGTACVISPIDKVIDTEKGKTYSFGDEPGPVLSQLYHALKDIQYGRAEDTHHWCDVFDI